MPRTTYICALGRTGFIKRRFSKPQESAESPTGAIPIFVKGEGLPWEYVGLYRVEAIIQNPSEIRIHQVRADRRDIGRCYLLSPDYLYPPPPTRTGLLHFTAAVRLHASRPAPVPPCKTVRSSHERPPIGRNNDGGF